LKGLAATWSRADSNVMGAEIKFMVIALRRLAQACYALEADYAASIAADVFDDVLDFYKTLAKGNPRLRKAIRTRIPRRRFWPRSTKRRVRTWSTR
jgi:hypothetical protein